MQTKTFKKLMAASLAAVMTVSFAACGDKDGGGKGGSGANKYPVLKDADGNTYDLGGINVTLRSWFGESDSQDEFSEAQKAWREWIQDTYNFTFTVDDTGSWGGTTDDLKTYAALQDDGQYMVYCMANNGTLISAMNEGLLYDLADLDCMDFTDQQYALNAAHKMFTKGNSIYACSVGFPEPRTGLFFNKRLLTETTGLTADDLYDLQKQNKWTWDEFEKLLGKIKEGGDTNNDGEADVYGFCANSTSWITACVFSNGAEWFSMKGGKYVHNLDDPKLTKAMDWGMRLMGSDYWYKNPYPPEEQGTHWDYFFAAFDEQAKCVFLPESSYLINPGQPFHPDNNDDEYGFLMFPMGPDASGYVNCYSDNAYAIPSNYSHDKAWKIAFAFDLWFATVPGYEDWNGRLSGYYAGASDTRLVDETLARMMSEGGTVDLSAVVGVNVGETLGWFDVSQAPSALREAAKTVWQARLDEINN